MHVQVNHAVNPVEEQVSDQGDEDGLFDEALPRELAVCVVDKNLELVRDVDGDGAGQRVSEQEVELRHLGDVLDDLPRWVHAGVCRKRQAESVGKLDGELAEPAWSARTHANVPSNSCRSGVGTCTRTARPSSPTA